MYSVQIETSDGTLSVINLGIEYFDKSDITLYRNDDENPLVLGTDWQWNSDRAIGLLKGAEPQGNTISVFRNTDKDEAFNIYDGNAPFSRDTLDENFQQLIYLAQEFTEGSGLAGVYRNLNMHKYRIINMRDPIDAQDAATKHYVDLETAARIAVDDTERAARIAADDTERAARIAADNAEAAARIDGDAKTLASANNYTDTELAGFVDVPGTSDVGVWVPSIATILAMRTLNYRIYTRGFYAAGDSGDGAWVSTGVTNTALAGTHVPKTARVYDALGHEYALEVNSGDWVDVRANGAKPVTDFNAATEDFVCIGEVVYGISRRIKNYNSTVDGRTSLQIKFGGAYAYRIGKLAIKAFSRTEHDYGDCHFYVRPSPANTFAATGKYMNAIERGIEDVQYISEIYGGAVGYGSITLTTFRGKGGYFYGDHAVGVPLSSASTGTGLYLFNAENFILRNTEFRGFAFNIQLVRTNKGSYYDYLGNTVLGNVIPEVATQSLGAYEGVHLYDVKSFDSKYGHLRTQSNWASYSNCHFENQVVWANNPDGNQLRYLVYNYAAGVVFHGGAIQCTNASQIPTKGMVYDKARGVDYRGMYVEYHGTAYTIGVPDTSFYSRASGIAIDSVGSQYTGTSAGKPLVAFEQGYFGSYSRTGGYTNQPWQTAYDYFSGVNTWHVGAPVPDLGAFPHGGYDFKYGTYGLYYAGSLPDVDSLRDTSEGNEFLTPYGLLVKSGALKLPLLNPSYGSNIMVFIKDLTGTFSPRNIVLNQYVNNNVAGGETSVNLYQTYGTSMIDYGNGYKAILVPNMNPRAGDSKMYTSAGNKLQITVTSGAPIILKAVQAYTGGFPLFPAALADYVPLSAATRLWGVQSTGSVDNPTFYGIRTGGGIFKMGDVINPWLPVSNADLYNANAYSNQSGNYGSSMEQRVVSGGYTYGGAMSGQTFNLTIVSVDSANSQVTVSVPDAYAPYVLMGMPLNITANSGGGAIGDTYIVRRVINTDGTVANQYTLYGALGSVGGTLAVSTTKTYTFLAGTTDKYSGVTGAWTVAGTTTLSGAWATVSAGDMRVGYLGGTGTKQVRMYYNGTDVSAGISSTGTNTLALTGIGGITLNGSLLTSTSYNFGSATQYPANIYSQNAVTVVSDVNYKAEYSAIADNLSVPDAVITQALLTNILAIKFQSWKLKAAMAIKGDEARWHVGVLAQDIITAFTNAGLDWTRYGVLIKEEVAQVVTEKDGRYTPVLEDGATSALPVDVDGFLEYDAAHDVVLASETGVITFTRTIYMVRMEEFYTLRLAAIENHLGI